jgi:PAS domain S-box-containing protein
MDHEGRIVEFNPAAEKCFGWRRDEAIGKGMADMIVPPELRARHAEGLRRHLTTGNSRILGHRIEMPALRADGSRFDAELTIVRIPDAEPPVFTGTLRDITERSRLEEALRESEQRFRSFMEHAPAVAWIKDARFRYTYVNRSYEGVYGRAAKDVLGREDFDLHAPELARFFREDDEKILRAGQAAQRMHAVPYADGRPAHWLVTKFPLADAAGMTGIAGIAIDLTARVEAEERVRTLVSRLVQAQELERRRVADGLHDLIGQNLTALGIDLQALKQRLQGGGDLIAGPRLDAMAALLDTTIDAIRGVMTDLRPAALEEFGLVPALRWYASQFSKRTGLKVATKAPRREMRLPPDAELALFRIVQEALTNAAKHSGGTSVEIRIRYGERLTLTVQDDGRGFADPVGARGARRGGFGLTTMRERAEAQGGSLRVEFPERGTRVVVEIPVAPHAD